MAVRLELVVVKWTSVVVMCIEPLVVSSRDVYSQYSSLALKECITEKVV